MIEIILLTIFISSLLGMGLILFKKIPLLLELSDVPAPKGYLASKVKESIKRLPGSEKINYELYLQKLLSKIRILTMKTEGKTENWLTRLRQRAIRKNGHNGDTY